MGAQCLYGTSSSRIIKHTGKTVEECRMLCVVDTKCVAIEYGVEYGGYHPRRFRAGDCRLLRFLNNVSRDCDGKYTNVDSYVKCDYGKFFKSIRLLEDTFKCDYLV